jgi:hypothetical protein
VTFSLDKHPSVLGDFSSVDKKLEVVCDIKKKASEPLSDDHYLKNVIWFQAFNLRRHSRALCSLFYSI